MDEHDYFDVAIAYNPDTEDLVAGAEFEVYAATDLNHLNPLEVFEPGPDGARIPMLTSDSKGVLRQFRVAGEPQQVLLKSGPFVVRATSSHGRQGRQGEQGDDGKSAYLMAVDEGYTGTETEYAQSLFAIPGVVAHHVVSAPDAAPVVFHGIFMEGAEPTPPNDGKLHLGWRIPAS